MRYWWVNQNQTYRAELNGNFMWSPKARTDGGRNQFYENMKAVAPGDVIFSFHDTKISSIGVVTGFAETAPKPDFGSVGLNWAHEGWYVPVFYCALDIALRPKDHIQIIRPFLPAKYSPLQMSGDGLQSVYLAEVPEPMAQARIALMGQAYFDALAELTSFPSSPDPETPPDDVPITDIGPTFREQVVKARRGQGVFRANVMRVESTCRVTGVSDKRHLKAGHIKPWRDADNTERLNGKNELLLSPHVDHLFDQGYISFSTTEQLLVVPDARRDVLDKWGIDVGVRVGTFDCDQQAFLEYHRVNVFRGEVR
jgi:putative restriction endonuclease